MSTDEQGASLPENAKAPDSFIDKWLVRWPEWTVVQVFVPQAQRRTILAWAALQQELTEAAWGGSDPRPGEAKLGWWQEELRGWSRGMRRHPLGMLLQACPADWQALASALPALGQSRERPTDAHEALRQVEAVARAFAGIDGVLLGEGPYSATAAGHVALVSLQLMHARLLAAGEQAVPLQELARSGHGDAVPSWARRVPGLPWAASGVPGVPGARGTPAEPVTAASDAGAKHSAPRFRRVTAALARRRLQQGNAAQPLPAWRALLTAWRAARN